MTRKVVTFDRWERDYGDRGPRWAGRAGPGWYSAHNMWRYDNGSIGPRPGLRAYNLTSVPNGNVRALTYYPATSKLLFVVDTKLYSFDPTTMTSQAVSTASGDLNAGSDVVAFGGAVTPHEYLTHRGDASYRWDASTNTLTEIQGSPGGRCMVRYGDRFYVGDTGPGEEQRVWYSDPADFETWDALSYFDVDYDFNVFELMPGSSRLVIHSDQNLWLYSGTPDAAQLRQVLRAGGVGIHQDRLAVVADGDEFWFVSAYKYSPGWSNGAIYDTDRFEMLKLDSSARIYYSFGEPTILMLGSNDRGLIRHNGTWTVHTFGEDISVSATRWGNGYFALHNTPGSSAATWWCFDATQAHRPGFTSDTYANVGDNSSTPEDMWLRTPEHLSSNGSEITVRQVIVEFTKWNTGSASTNHFDVKVRATNLYDTSSHRDSATLTFDEPGSSASTAGVEQRANFTFGDQGSAAGFEIHLSNIRGVAIRAIHVVYDEATGRAPA